MAKRLTLAERQHAYRATFCGDQTGPHPMGRQVLSDLRKFCKVDTGGLVVSPRQRMTDPYATMYRNGLRDAYLHIAMMLGVDIANYQETETDGTAAPAHADT